jgi:hypothetical protein
MKGKDARWRVWLRQIGWGLVKISRKKLRQASVCFRPKIFETVDPTDVAKFLVSDYGAQVIFVVNQDKRGVLWHIEQIAHKPEPGTRNEKGHFVKRIVQVRNPSDGKFCFLEVPLTSEFAEDQPIATAHDAVAWSFQLGPADYIPVRES